MPYLNREQRKKLFEEKFAAGKTKIQLQEQTINNNELAEEVLSTKKEVKSFEVGSKVKLIDGKYKDKIATIKYCDGGKCVIQLGNEQLFIDANSVNACNEKPLSEHSVEESFLTENEEDAITVKVDGEVIADTSKETEQEIPVEENSILNDVGSENSEPSAAAGIVELLMQAVKDEYNTISFYNTLIANANEQGFSDIASVINHINEEENIHVGMLQHAITQLSEQAKQIETGKEEAEQILNGEDSTNLETNDSLKDTPEVGSEEI